MKNKTKKYAFTLVEKDQAVIFKRRPKPRHIILLILSLTFVPACAVAGFFVAELNNALLVAGGALVFFLIAIIPYMEVKKTKLVIENAEKITWSTMRLFKVRSGDRKIADIPKDANGYRFKIRNWINNAPGAMTTEGKPAYISVNAVKENGKGYENVFYTRSAESYADDIIQLILKYLPYAYLDES